jgi:arsenate reductase (glutaredoxin)
MEVQIFGTGGSADTRKAQRFFAERRIRTHFVDLRKRAASPGELKRFAQRFGAAALVDREAPRFRDLGLAGAAYGEDRWLERLAADPLLLRQPLVRWGPRLTVGLAESDWRAWIEAGRAGGR